MAEAELQTFAAVMDSLVRISVSMTFILLWDLFQPRVLHNDTPASGSLSFDQLANDLKHRTVLKHF